MHEALYYNALAIKTSGSYSAIKKAKYGHTTWRAAFDAFERNGADTPDVDPFKAWEVVQKADVHVVLLTDEEFPKRLREIPHPPFGIYIRGTLARHAATIGIVGTRRASPDGKDIAKNFGREIATCGIAIASGLAFGIDTAAHQGCLDANGTTIAVFAGGLDDIYPRSNRHLAEKILECGGALVSEYPFGEAPLAFRFIERNRIISGLSQGVVVVEAPEGSGALATARFALEQDRDVFVVPGSTLHTNFKGSNELIRQGATLVTSAKDILESYEIYKSDKKDLLTAKASAEEILILKALESALFPLDVDKIIQITKLEPRIVNQALSFLLIKGFIKEIEDGYTM